MDPVRVVVVVGVDLDEGVIEELVERVVDGLVEGVDPSDGVWVPERLPVCVVVPVKVGVPDCVPVMVRLAVLVALVVWEGVTVI